MRTVRMPVTVELIPDPEQAGFTARLPDIPAYGEGKTARRVWFHVSTTWSYQSLWRRVREAIDSFLDCLEKGHVAVPGSAALALK